MKTNSTSDEKGMIVAYGIAGCIIMQKPFRECLNWYGVDPEGEGMKTFKEGYRTDKKMCLLLRGRVINKCNIWSELFLESYPTIDTSLVLLLTGEYRNEFLHICPEEREGVEISSERPGVLSYIQKILEDYYDFREITTLKVISGPSSPEESLHGKNSIHDAIYDYEDADVSMTPEPAEMDTPDTASSHTTHEEQVFSKSFSDLTRSIGNLHVACLELTLRLLGSGLRFLLGIR